MKSQIINRNKFHFMNTLVGSVIVLVVSMGVDNAFAEKNKIPAFVKQGKIIKLAPGTNLKALGQLPNNQVIETFNGHRVTVLQATNIAKIRNRLRSKPIKLSVPMVRSTAKATKLRDRTQFASMIRKSPNTVLQLPSGKKLTVGQFKILQKSLEEKLGRKILSAKRAGPVIRVKAGTPIYQLLRRKDTDVLENKKGQRITVGDLREYMKSASKKSRSGSHKSGKTDIYRTSSGKTFRGDQAALLLSLPDSETITGPNGKKMTVGALKRMQGTRKKPPAPLKLPTPKSRQYKLPSGGTIPTSQVIRYIPMGIKK